MHTRLRLLGRFVAVWTVSTLVLACSSVAGTEERSLPAERVVLAYTRLWSLQTEPGLDCATRVEGVLVPSGENAAPDSYASLRELGDVVGRALTVLWMRCPATQEVAARARFGDSAELEVSRAREGPLTLRSESQRGRELIALYNQPIGHRAMTVVNPGGWGTTSATMGDEWWAYRHMVIQRELDRIQLLGCGPAAAANGIRTPGQARRFAEEATRLAELRQFDFALTYGKLALSSLLMATDRQKYLALPGATPSCAAQLGDEAVREAAERYVLPVLTNMAVWAARVGRLDEAQQAMALVRQLQLALVERRPLPLQQAAAALPLAPYEVGVAEALGMRSGARPPAIGPRDQAAQSAERQRHAPAGSVDPKLAVVATPEAQRSREDARWLAAQGHRTVMLSYYVADKETAALVVLPNGDRQVFGLPVGRQALWRAVERMRILLATSPAANDAANLTALQTVAKQLDTWLVAPVAAAVSGAAPDTVLISSPGVLAHLPWSALHDGRSWLIERWPLVSFSEAAAGTVRRKAEVPARMALFAASRSHVVDGKPLPAIPRTLDEVRRIREVLGGGASLYEDATFTWDRFAEAVTGGRHNGLHIASHFAIRPGAPELSFFVLGDGKQMPVAALEQLDFNRSEIVFLAACDTAMGQLSPRSGYEVESALLRFVRQGASSVVGTLQWVDDEATALLTREFYAALAQGGGQTGKAQALRNAQLALLRGEAVAPSGRLWARSSRRLDHPAYWAPFVLIGNWR